MSTDPAYTPASSFQPVARCWRCKASLDRKSRFCPECGFDLTLAPDARPATPQGTLKARVIEAGQPVWPPPAAPLKTVQRVAGSNDLPARPLHSATQSRPLERAEIEASLQSHRPRSGFTDALDTLFKHSGPLPHLPEPEPPAQPWVTPEQLPKWLEGAQQFSNRQTDQITPPWLNSSGKTHPPFPDATEMPSGPDWRDTLKGRALPHLPEPGAGVKIEPYPPLPDGKIICPNCHGYGRDYKAASRANLMPPCGVCKETGRIPAPIAQPTPGQPEEAEVTGPTDVALAAIPPANVPQTTDPIETIVEETEGPRRHLEDLLEEIAETMTGAGVQMDFWATRLSRQRDRLTDTIKRLDWASSAELMVLGMTEDAAKKAVTLLEKAASAAKESEKHLMSVEMALDVGLIHVTAWVDSYGSGGGHAE